MIRQKSFNEWKEHFEPHAELIGQLTHPEIYKEYRKFRDKIAEKKSKGKPIDITIPTEKGSASYAATDSKYDPQKGLVDAKGNIIVPKEKFEKMMHLDGIPVSF